jgi:hypothetical protein
MRCALRSLRDLLARVEREMTKVDAQLHHRLKSDLGYQAVVRLPKVGKVLGAVFFAEIGDVHRFDSARKLCSRAGLTPKQRESDTVVHRSAITKQDRASSAGPPSRPSATTGPRAMRSSEPTTDASPSAGASTRPRVAVALTLVFYALRDGEVECLDTPAAAA